jgi:serine/threonine protein phosphatase PrpC
MNITAHSEQKSRPYQEDRFFVKEISSGETVLGVFDGHGGDWVSEYCAKHTPYIFRALLKNKQNSYPEILGKVINRLHEKTKDFYSGSTASLVLIAPDQKFACVAILGDSPVIIKDANENVWVAPEHNVRSNQKEAELATKDGNAFISNGYLFDRSKGMNSDGLQMSRALGDRSLNNVLNRIPEIFGIELNENSWILCGSDGLSDPGHTSFDVNDLVKKIPTASAETLTKEAGIYDNATAILVKI